MTLNSKQLDSISSDMQKYAGNETVNSVSQVNDTIYVYTSELGAYRINAKYANPSKTRVAYSENLNTWFFALDI